MCSPKYYGDRVGGKRTPAVNCLSLKNTWHIHAQAFGPNLTTGGAKKWKGVHETLGEYQVPLLAQGWGFTHHSMLYCFYCSVSGGGNARAERINDLANPTQVVTDVTNACTQLF